MTTTVSMKTFQGASQHTERKEFEIGELVRMRLTQLKGKAAYFHDEVMIADVFSGSGENVIGGKDPIDGSPIRILDAVRRAVVTQKGVNLMGFADRPVNLFFSDIRPAAIGRLTEIVSQRWQPIDGLSTHINTAVLPASSAMDWLHTYMTDHPRTHLILVLDPNGPKDFPRDEALSLLRDYSRRIDLIPYISATAINRCLRHRDICGAHYDWWLAAIDRFDTGFVHAIAANRHGWVREPLASDAHRWLMLPTFTPYLIPKHDWAKQGYVAINSPRGQAAIATYSGTKEAA